MAAQPKFIVVIGASAGGLNALAELVQTLPAGLDVAYCIVLHLSRKGIGDFVVHRLNKVTSMQCSMAVSGATIEAANIYVAPPNQHLLVKDGKILLGAGPQENRFRPSIDVLFRSAAVAYTSHAIGIILSGMLDDGTSGMWAIKRSGGACIVQDPNQAEYPDMPLSVINNMDVDYVSELGSIGGLLVELTSFEQDSEVRVQAPQEVILESQIAEKTAVGIDAVEQIADKSVFACPDCGGNLWAVKGDIINRYRCHIGHAYTEQDLVVKQAETASTTLWVALRMMEERKHLLRKLEVDYAQKGYTSLATDHLERKDEMQRHIDTLKMILFDLQNHDTVMPY
ncbi:chemotaxis protein CheB [Dyadobacter fanqingshengii]|uniref:protein-glutamate methylesterase n=1 Tax=Dyadobacter fanqingshengii TaxID=2906443 RepID=A0A9X1PC99_9BACT|nr:chemotaxis protein CheB [Dyadobacter fanqingshengii]MCF0040860.1 chemotaxis protein CheB [Dyadobacter fanqingshengii]MCF2506036.1 chemotaxis protein CheB [Dyadobacter fanqingshengii]USJ37407.1 chemotaxis protein CheB [Dyadobacter fanqingshengii]